MGGGKILKPQRKCKQQVWKHGGMGHGVPGVKVARKNLIQTIIIEQKHE